MFLFLQPLPGAGVHFFHLTLVAAILSCQANNTQQIFKNRHFIVCSCGVVQDPQNPVTSFTFVNPVCTKKVNSFDTGISTSTRGYSVCTKNHSHKISCLLMQMLLII